MKSTGYALLAAVALAIACRSQSNPSHAGSSYPEDAATLDAGIDADAGPANPIGPIASRDLEAIATAGGSANNTPSAPPPYDLPGAGRGDEFPRGGRPGKLPIGMLTSPRASLR